MSQQQFTLEYVIKLTGGAAAGSQLNQVNNQLKVGSTNTQQLTTAQQKLGAVTGKTNQQIGQATRNYKGLAFGLIGLTSAGVEAIGMLGMYAETSQRTTEAQEKLNKLVEDGKEGTKEFTDASNELVKAQRFQSMVTRNLVLSMFDMVPFTLLTVNALVSLRREGVGISQLFTGLTGVFNRFRSAAVVPAVADLTRLGTTFTTFNSTAVTGTTRSMTSLGTIFTSFRGQIAPVNTAMTTAQATFKATAGSAIPLAASIGAVGVSSGAAAGGVGILSKALLVLKANIRGVLLATGIGAALVGIGLIAEHFLSARDAVQEAGSDMEVSAEGIRNHMAVVQEAVRASQAGVTSSSSKMAKDFSEAAVEMAADIDKLTDKFAQIPNAAEVAFLKTKKAQLTIDMSELLAKREASQTKPRHVGRAPTMPTILSKEDLDTLAQYDKSIADIDARITDLISKGTAGVEFGEKVFKSPAILAADFGVKILELQQSAAKVAPKLQEIFGFLEVLAVKFKGDPAALQFVKDIAVALLDTDKSLSELDKTVMESMIDVWFDSFGVRMEDLTDGGAQLTDSLANLKATMAPLQEQTSKQVAEFLALKTELGGLMDVQGLNMAQLQAMQQLYTDNIQVHLDTAQAIKNEIEFWTRLDETMFQAAIASQQFIFDQIKVTGIFDETTKNALLFNQAAIEGKQAAADWFTELVLGVVKTQQFGIEIETVAEQLGILPASIELTTEELQRLIEAEATTGTHTEALADIVNERLAPAFEVFNAAIQAEDLGDFREEFEKIDFGDLSDKVVGHIEGLTESMKKAAEQGLEFNNLLSTLTVHGDNLSKKDWRKIFDELSDSLQRFINLDPDAKVLGPFADFLDDLNAEERKEVFKLMGDDLFYLADAMSNGDLTPEEVNAFLAKLSSAIGTVTGNSTLLVNKLGELRDEFGELVSIDINPEDVGKQVQDVLGITSAIEAGKVVLTPDQQFKQNTATLATNTGNLVTSTDTLKSSIDTLNTNITSGPKNGILPINLMPWMPPDGQGAGDIIGGGGMWGNMGNDNHEQLRISDGEDKGEEEKLNIWQQILQAAMQTILAIEIAFKTMEINLMTVFTNLSTAWTLNMGIILVAAQLNTTLITQGMQLMIATLTAQFAVFGLLISAQFVFIELTALTSALNILTGYTVLTTALTAQFMALATTWSVVCNSFIANAKAAASGIIASINQVVSVGIAGFNKLAAAAISAFNRMRAAAVAAINQIISRLNAIPRRIDVTVHVGVTGPGVKFMAKGFHGVVNTPTLMMVGEAGPERVDISKTSSPATGLMINRDMNVTPELAARNRNPVNVGGDVMVAVYLDGEQVKGKIVKMIVQDSGAFK